MLLKTSYKMKPPVSAKPNKSHPLARGLVGLWLLNEGSGNKVFDLSGNGNIGSATGIVWTPGKYGSALEFTADSTDTVNCGTGAMNSVVGTMIMFANISEAWDATDAKYNATVNKGIIFDRGWGLCIYEKSAITGIYLNGWTRNAAGYFEMTADLDFLPTWNVGEWHMIGVRLDSANLMSTIWDGAIHNSATTNRPPALADLITRNFYIGDCGSSEVSWPGSVSHVLAYNRALSASEIAQLYREPFCMFKDPAEIAFFSVPTGQDFLRTIDDSLGLADITSRASVFGRSFSESIGVTDVDTKISEMVRVLSESLGIVDATLKDEIKSVSDTIGLTDIVVKALGINLSESIGISDADSKVSEMVRTLAESLGITDSSLKQEYKVVSDSLGLTDVVSRTSVFLRTIAESMAISDEVTKVWTIIQLVDNNIGITDAHGSIIGQWIIIADSLGISDSVTRLISYLRTQDDDIEIADAIVKVAVALRTIDDSMGISDEMAYQLVSLMKAVWAFMVIRQTQS